MEEKKDPRTHTAIDTKGQPEGFLGGSHIAFVFKKIERLSTAVYLITNLWDDREPLKWKLRDRNLCLIEESSKYHYSRLLDRSRVGGEIISRVAEIVSLLEIAFSSALLSEMNLRVLKEEYVYLMRLIEEKETSFLSLSKSFFEAKGDEPNYLKAPNLGNIEGPSKGGDDLYKGHKGHDSISKMSFIKKQSPAKELQKSVPASGSEVDDRREKILALVKSRGEITIKDAVSVIKGYSEKTIQRELLAMTASGLLKKKGERRWSRYSLK